jgi:hypothetical protein
MLVPSISWIGAIMPPRKNTPEQENAQAESSQVDQPQVVNLTYSKVDSLQTELARVHQSALRSVIAEELELHQSGAARVTAQQVKGQESAVGMLQAGEVDLTNSGVGAIRAHNVSLDGRAGLVLTDSAAVGDAYLGAMVGRQVQAERIQSVVLLARHVKGDVSTVIDTRSAVLAGMIGGLFAGLTMLAGRRLFRQK